MLMDIRLKKSMRILCFCFLSAVNGFMARMPCSICFLFVDLTYRAKSVNGNDEVGNT